MRVLVPGAPSGQGWGMRIGLMGGSFDPVHLGHVGVAGTVARALGLGRVLLVPAAQAPLRSAPVRASAAHRVAMLRLALETDSLLGVSEIELRRGGVSYTIDTLRALHAERPGDEFVWILGEDQLARLPQWSEPVALAALTEFAAYGRPGCVRAEPPAIPGLKVTRVEGPEWPISSTEIRSRIASGESLAGLLPDKVIEYIRENGLYA
jgi:nicotinate-nucleotide adenylyltransferase